MILPDQRLVWVLLAASLVMFMQPGFAMVEAGFTRAKNSANILMKNIMDFSFGSLFFWLIGFSIMFGTGNVGFMGSIYLFGSGIEDGDLPGLAILIFQASALSHKFQSGETKRKPHPKNQHQK